MGIIGPELQSMFYKAKQTHGQWDTWLYYDDGQYYLFYLTLGGELGYSAIGQATSADGVHWVENGMILHAAEGVWALGTGSTWQSPRFELDSKFFLNFSEWRGSFPEGRQTIFFAESTDLRHWRRLLAEHEFVQDGRWYEEDGRWDCIYAIPKSGGGLYGYWTATPKPSTGGEFGFGWSADGITWKALAPPQVIGAGKTTYTDTSTGRVSEHNGEVGAIHEIDGHFYMMFGSAELIVHGSGPQLKLVGSKGRMTTLIADCPHGPFLKAKKNPTLLSGNTYFSRFVPTPSGLLVNHHCYTSTSDFFEPTSEVYFAPLKQAVVDADGTLRLKWWPENERLKHVEMRVRVDRVDTRGLTWINHRFNADRGIVLEVDLELPTRQAAHAVGLCLECEENHGIGILLGKDCVTEIGAMRIDTLQFRAEYRIDRELQLPQTVRARLLLKETLSEFYLDDHLIHCWSLPQPCTGRIALVRQQTIGRLQTWE